MEHVEIEGTDLKLSRIGLGTWAIGGAMWGGTDAKASIRTIHAALERGISLIDTAPAYGGGTSEELVGEALSAPGLRDKAVVATKVGLEWEGGIRRNSSPARVRQELEDSLRRLRTDHIDIYQVHWPDTAVPFEETAEVLRKAFDEGKIRAIGVSNFTPEQMERFRSVAPLHTVQPPYNLFEREAEADVLPYCQRRNITTLTYGAICRGLLSGRMRPDTPFPEGDLRRVDPKFQPPRFAQYLAAVERLDQLAQQRHGRRVIHLALRWVLDQPGVGAALWGARRPDQLAPVDDVLGWRLDDEDRAEVERILRECIPEPVGAEFMAPPPSREAGSGAR